VYNKSQEKLLRHCDQTMAFGFYGTIFFLPIAGAFVEGFFILILLTYLFKRGAAYSFQTKEQNLSLKQKTFLLLKAYKPVDSPINKVIGLYIFVAFLSVLFSQYPMLSIKGFVFKLLQGAFSYFLCVECINSKKRLRIFMTIFFLSMSVILTNGIYQQIVREGFIRHHPITDGRLTSSFKHANDFGGYLAVILPMLMIVTFSFTKSIKFRLWTGILFLMGMVCLGFTFSRSAWLALIASVIFIGLKWKRIFIPLLLVLIMFLVLFVPKIMSDRSMGSRMEEGIFTLSGRIVYWKEAAHIIQAYPILGVGLNAYSLVAPKYKIIWGGYPHNCYLQLAAEMGLVGLMAFLWMIFRFFQFGIKRAIVIEEDFDRHLMLGLLAGLFGYFVQSFFDTNFYSVQIGNYMWVMMGVVGAIGELNKNSLKDRIENKKKINIFLTLTRSLLVISAVVVSVVFVDKKFPNRLYSEIYFTLGRICDETCSLDTQLWYFHKAQAHNDKFPNTYYEIGELNMQKGKDQEAKDFFDKAMSMDPGLAESYRSLILRFYYNTLKCDQCSIEEKEQTYNKILVYMPAHAKSYQQLGYLADQRGNKEEAVAYFKKAFLLDEDMCDAYYYIGLFHFERNDIDEAYVYFKKGYEHKTREFIYDLANYLGIISELKGMIGEAAAYYEQAGENYQKFPDARVKAVIMYDQVRSDLKVRVLIKKMRESNQNALADRLENHIHSNSKLPFVIKEE